MPACRRALIQPSSPHMYRKHPVMLHGPRPVAAKRRQEIYRPRLPHRNGAQPARAYNTPIPPVPTSKVSTPTPERLCSPIGPRRYEVSRSISDLALGEQQILPYHGGVTGVSHKMRQTSPSTVCSNVLVDYLGQPHLESIRFPVSL